MLFQVLLCILCIAKPIKILVVMDLQFVADNDRLTAAYLTALSPINLNGTLFNASDFQVDRVAYDSNYIGEVIDKVGWACRSGEYQAVIADTISRDAKIYGLLCGYYNVPTAALYNTANILSDKKRYPTLFRYNPSITLLTHSILLYIQKMGWKNLVLVVGNDNPMWNEASALTHTLASQYGISIVSEIPINTLDAVDPANEYKKAIDQLRFNRGKLIYIIAYDFNTMDFILASEYHGISRNEYTFLIFNNIIYQDDIASVDYWAKYGMTLNMASRNNISGVNFVINLAYREEWTTSLFNPNIDGVIKQGPYFNVDMNHTGNDPILFYPDVFYESPSLAYETIFIPFDAIVRLILSWQSV